MIAKHLEAIGRTVDQAAFDSIVTELNLNDPEVVKRRTRELVTPADPTDSPWPFDPPIDP